MKKDNSILYLLMHLVALFLITFAVSYLLWNLFDSIVYRIILVMTVLYATAVFTERFLFKWLGKMVDFFKKENKYKE